jgi:hypothetical protein
VDLDKIAEENDIVSKKTMAKSAMTMNQGRTSQQSLVP